MAFACQAALPAGEVSPEQKSRSALAVLEIIASAESEVARAGYIAEAAAHLRLPEAALQRDFQRLLGRQERQAGFRGRPPTSRRAGLRRMGWSRSAGPPQNMIC